VLRPFHQTQIIYSISVLQWLCNAETSSPTSSPPFRLNRFFTTLHASLSRSSRAVLQFYPNSDDQVKLIMGIAMKAGFQGGLVVDYPNSRKAKKFFLCLFTGGSSSSAKAQQVEIPKGLTGEGEDEDDIERVQFEKHRARQGRGERGKKRKPPKEATKDWILRKKEVCRFQSSFPSYSYLMCRFYSFIDNGAKKGCRATRSSLGGNERRCSESLWIFCSFCIGHTNIDATLPGRYHSFLWFRKQSCMSFSSLIKSEESNV
jgi:Methyltransferase involved in Williams-Beuren syndrome